VGGKGSGASGAGAAGEHPPGCAEDRTSLAEATRQDAVAVVRRAEVVTPGAEGWCDAPLSVSAGRGLRHGLPGARNWVTPAPTGIASWSTSWPCTGAPGFPYSSRRRILSLRYLAADARHAPRPWRTSPPFDGLQAELPAGGAMDHPLFPVVWPPCLAPDVVYHLT
jgi:hypothetical protein